MYRFHRGDKLSKF